MTWLDSIPPAHVEIGDYISFCGVEGPVVRLIDNANSITFVVDDQISGDRVFVDISDDDLVDILGY